MTLAVYLGTFDPITLGHVDVVTHAHTVFDRVVVGIAHNAAKHGRHLFDLDKRLELARASLAHLSGVEVDVVPGLLADYCRERGAGSSSGRGRRVRTRRHLKGRAPGGVSSGRRGLPGRCR